MKDHSVSEHLRTSKFKASLAGRFCTPSKSLANFMGKRATLAVLFGRVAEAAVAEVPESGHGPTASTTRLRCEFFDGGTVRGHIVPCAGQHTATPCLAVEYMLQPLGSRKSVAETRAVAWREASSKEGPRLVDEGPYSVAARRVIAGVPTFAVEVDVECV